MLGNGKPGDGETPQERDWTALFEKLEEQFQADEPQQDDPRVKVDAWGTRTMRDEQGRLHCDDAPAVERPDGYVAWYQHGQLHRMAGPAVFRADGTQLWFVNGVLHRLDGPAVEHSDGSREWYWEGRRHRDDGPSAEWANGTLEWWVNGRRHRVGGAAIEEANGLRYYWLDGVEVDPAEARSGIPTPLTRLVNGHLMTDDDGLWVKYWTDEDGLFHSIDGPAVLHDDGRVEYWLHGEPTTSHYIHKAAQRGDPESVPVVNEKNGNRVWVDANGELHRSDGPAVEHPDGYCEWWVDGELHRFDGPAIVWGTGEEFWYLHDQQVDAPEDGELGLQRWAERAYLEASRKFPEVETTPNGDDEDFDQ